MLQLCQFIVLNQYKIIPFGNIVSQNVLTGLYNKNLKVFCLASSVVFSYYKCHVYTW